MTRTMETIYVKSSGSFTSVPQHLARCPAHSVLSINVQRTTVAMTQCMRTQGSAFPAEEGEMLFDAYLPS